MMVRMVTSEGLSETMSVSPKNSPSESSAMRRLVPWAPLLRTSTCPWARMKKVLPSSPSPMSVLPRDTCSVLKRAAMRLTMPSGRREKSGTLRRLSGVKTGLVPASPPERSTPIRRARGSSTLVRLTR